MVVDCGGGTVDLTTRELLDGDKLSEITVRAGDNCGSCFVDQAFIEFFGSKIGKSANDILKEDYYVNLQYIVQEFCVNTKIFFTGQEEEFQTFYLNLDEYEPIKQYIIGEEKEKLEADEWIIEVKFDDVKKMFDPIIKKIIRLIREQLAQQDIECSAIMLVGGFSESKYLQARIREEFKVTRNISVPMQPMIAVVKGGVQFGLQTEVVVNRVLKRTYGTLIF